MIIAPLYEYSNKAHQYSNDSERIRIGYDEYAALAVRLHKGAEIKVAYVRHGLLSDIGKPQGPVLSTKKTMGVRHLQQKYEKHKYEHPELDSGCLLLSEKENLARYLESASVHRSVKGETCALCEALYQDASEGVCPVIECYEIVIADRPFGKDSTRMRLSLMWRHRQHLRLLQLQSERHLSCFLCLWNCEILPTVITV